MNPTQPTTAFHQAPLDQIVSSLTNPRKTFDPAKLAELAESIRASGVHTPVLLRPLPSERLEETAYMDPRPSFELVSGERRYRASELAGVPTIPAIVKALTDDQVLEIQLVENLQRDDLLPLEEAEGYEHLRSRHEPPLSAEQIGERIGKSRSYVYARLKLLNLGQEGRAAMREGWLDASTALLIARIPDGKIQAAALGNLRDISGRVMSYREASALIQRQYMLRLTEAKFKITDATLVPDAGSCRACPKRTGADPDIFSDVQGADVCTDPACFRTKEQAHTDAQLKTARENGATIIEGREAKELIQHSWSDRVDGYLRLDHKDDAPGGDKTLRQLIGKQMEKAGITPTMVANPHRDGELIAVITHEDASRLLSAKGYEDKAEAIQAKAHQSAKEAERAEQMKETERFENAWRWKVLTTAWEKITSMEEGLFSVTEATIRHLAKTLIPHNQERCKRLCKLLELGTVAPSAALHDWVRDHNNPDEALALLVMNSDLEYRTWGEPESQINQALIDVATAKHVGVDIEAVKAEIKAEHTAQIKAKKKALAAESAGAAKADLPLNPAAQANGVGGEAKAKGKKSKGPAAPAARKPKTSAEEAMLGIAAAMQGQEEDGGADCGPLESDPAADGGGDDGRATSPDAGADQPDEALETSLVNEARRIVVTNQKASISYVQRTLKVSYNRAAHLLCSLEAMGVVSPMHSSGLRDVLEQPGATDRGIWIGDRVEVIGDSIHSGKQGKVTGPSAKAGLSWQIDLADDDPDMMHLEDFATHELKVVSECAWPFPEGAAA